MIRDNIEVEIMPIPGTGRQSAGISDRVSGRVWSGEGATMGEAATEAMRKFLGDRRAREYVGEP
jgi:hypothetical protein